MLGFLEANMSPLIYETIIYIVQLFLRVVIMLLIAVFLAEAAKLWLGEERLKVLLAGNSAWVGRLRALILGAVLPFCECGAFPVMLGLIRAGLPAGVVLTFFLVSPVVSMPAFMILVAVFGLNLAVLYLAITLSAAFVGSFILEALGQKVGIFQAGIAVNYDEEKSESLLMAKNNSCSGDAQLAAEVGCCSSPVPANITDKKEKAYLVASLALQHTIKLLKRILPYIAVVVLFTALLRNLVPQEQIQNVLKAGAPFDVPIAALIGIPVYSGDCGMIALAAPLISATGALGAGIAFIIAGSGTSINGIIFMSSVFQKRFLIYYILIVFCIAVIVGYAVTGLVALGLV